MAFAFAALANCAYAGVVLNSAYWAEGSTDLTGNYTYNGPGATQSGTAVIGNIPTNGTQNFPRNDVVNYFRTGTYIPGAGAAYNGVLLGNLTSYTGLTAVFSLNDSLLTAGQTFDASSIVGEGYSGQVGSNAGLRLMFMGSTPLSDGTPNQWWSNPAAVFVTSMNNGQDYTLTVLFDASQWSNYNGKMGTDPLAAGQFQAALSDVARLGISFGSGYFYSNGFSFNNGGTAYIQLDSINTLAGEVGTTGGSAGVPEPATCALLAGGFALIAAVRRTRARF